VTTRVQEPRGAGEKIPTWLPEEVRPRMLQWHWTKAPETSIAVVSMKLMLGSCWQCVPNV
jgi:hypothetical protein